MVAKTSPDYDPLTAAFDAGFEQARSEGQTSREQQRLKLAKKTEKRKQERARERSRERRVAQSRERERVSAQSRREADRLTLQRQSLALRQRESVERAQRNAAADARRQARTVTAPKVETQSVNAPSFTIGSGNLDRTSAARLIVVLTVLSAGGVIITSVLASNTIGPTTVKVGNDTVKVPSHLRALGATIIVGTISLVVAEISPGGGLALMVAFALVVFFDLFTNARIVDRLSGNLFGGKSPAPGSTIATPGTAIRGPDGSILFTGPHGSRLVPVPGRPGQYSQEPLPAPNA